MEGLLQENELGDILNQKHSIVVKTLLVQVQVMLKDCIRRWLTIVGYSLSVLINGISWLLWSKVTD